MNLKTSFLIHSSYLQVHQVKNIVFLLFYCFIFKGKQDRHLCILNRTGAVIFHLEKSVNDICKRLVYKPDSKLMSETMKGNKLSSTRNVWSLNFRDIKFSRFSENREIEVSRKFSVIRYLDTININVIS